MRLAVGAAFLGALLVASAVAEDKFDLAPPPVLSNDVRMNLWSTYYYVLAADAVPPSQGFKLLGRNGQDLGVSLRKRAWCDAAIEGTVTVNDSPRPPRTFNFFGVWQRQVDCLQYYPSYPQISRTIYAGVPADAPFGLGDTPTFRLVPFRSIAVDRSVPAFRLKAGNQIRKVALFIPGLRGIPIKTPDGRSVQHDGYVFAADTGGGIKGNHIDFFSGTDPNNPAPNLILSTARPTFPAYLVQDASIREFLYKLHTRD